MILVNLLLTKVITYQQGAKRIANVEKKADWRIYILCPAGPRFQDDVRAKKAVKTST